MFQDTIFLSTFNQLRVGLLNDLTILHIATGYILMYVIYKTIGRYIYFKPQEHASKINRTFLTVSLLILIVHTLSQFMNYLPIISNFRWLYVLCIVVMIIAVLSIIIFRIIWKYDGGGYKSNKDWHYHYLPLTRDYYKAAVSQSSSSGNFTNNWEVEGVQSTSSNIHSDALINLLALTVFIFTIYLSAYRSIEAYGIYAILFSSIIGISISAAFINEGIFSWVDLIYRRFSKQ